MLLNDSQNTRNSNAYQHAEWQRRDNRNDNRAFTHHSQRDTAEGREAYERAIRMCDVIRRAVDLASHNYDNATGLQAIKLAQRTFMTTQFCRNESPYGDCNTSLMNGLMKAGQEITDAVNGKLSVDERRLFTQTWDGYKRNVIKMLVNDALAKFTKLQRTSQNWFMAQHAPRLRMSEDYMPDEDDHTYLLRP